MTKYHLGIGGTNHDFAAAIVKDGRIVVAIEQERLDRCKHGSRRWNSSPTALCIDYCMTSLHIDGENVSGIYANSDHLLINNKVLGKDITPFGHHYLHGAASFYSSAFEESAIMVIDGHGEQVNAFDAKQNEFQTISMGVGKGTDMVVETVATGVRKATTLNWHYIVSNSLGSFYKLVSELIGFGMHGTGKTMGLAAYGDESLLSEMKQFVFYREDVGFIFDPYSGISDWVQDVFRRNNNKAQTRANIAFAAQSIFESVVIALANHCYKLSNSKYLSYGGGCALNTVANKRILEDTRFENLHVYPAAGDAGLAIGAALAGYYSQSENKTRKIIDPKCLSKQAFTGKTYTEKEIKLALDSYPVLYKKLENPIETISEMLGDNQIIGMFRGGSEIGPRALGHRSIIASPNSIDTLNKINLKIKNRESFRPLAPMTKYENLNKYFELNIESPFMLLVSKVKNKYRDKLRAVTHFDGTARVQTVRKESDPFLYNLLSKVEVNFGCAVILNTSFNKKDEPIVETPSQAIECFLEQDLDALYIDGFIVEKHTPWTHLEY